MPQRLNRRSFLTLSVASATTVILGSQWSQSTRAAQPTFGPQAGDVTSNSAVIWGRADRAARLFVDLSTSPNFEQIQTRRGPRVGPETDFTGKLDLQGLQPDTTYYYQVRFGDGRNANRLQGAPQGPIGKFRTAPPPGRARTTRFVWAADLAGQGWGRNPDLAVTAFDGTRIQGGYVIFEAMRKLEPDFALFSGDMIYGDVPLPPKKPIPQSVGGGTWINDPALELVATSVDGFRDNWKYNLGDAKLARFLQQVPVYIQWDDHEVTNNWYPQEILQQEPYNGLSAQTLAERSKQALLEYNPIRGESIFRAYQYGRDLELFILDERSFRGPNDGNTQPSLLMLGQQQREQLKQRLRTSRATWKVIATDTPLSIVTGGPGDFDAWSQGDQRVLGREAPLRELLQFIRAEDIQNVVWLTADVHFPAAIFYDPARATFGNFKPFWEFVIGPINAGAFGPAADPPLDPSFGPQFDFKRFPQEPNLPPPNNQFFGSVEVDGRSSELTVGIHDITGQAVYQKQLRPE